MKQGEKPIATAKAPPAARAKNPKAAAKPKLTTVYVVKRSSRRIDDDCDSDDEDRPPTVRTWTVGTYAHQAAAEKACRAEYRALGIDRRHIFGRTTNWSFEGAVDLLDPDTAMDETREVGRVVSEKHDRRIHKMKDVDWSEGEDVETDVDKSRAVDDACW